MSLSLRYGRESRRLPHYCGIYPTAFNLKGREATVGSRAMNALLHLLTGSQSRLSPVPSKTPPPGTRIRPYGPADRDACIDIYQKNEPGRFPAGVGGQFEEFLDQQGYLKLVCSIAEELVAIAGVGQIPALLAHHVWLVFGMVRPDFQRRGIGTAMLLARLAALPRPARPVRVMLSSVPHPKNSSAVSDSLTRAA
jgi:GNAT superfamily N-acetyltransferase